MKPVRKGVQVTLRLSLDVVEGMKAHAQSENLSLADYVTKLFKESQTTSDVEARLRRLEQWMYQSQNVESGNAA